MKTAKTAFFSTTILAMVMPLAAAAQEIEVWTRASEESFPVYEEIGKAFTAKTGIQIKFFNTLTDFEQRLSRAAAGRDLPDVVINDAAAIGQMHSMNIIDEVDPATIAGSDQIIPTAWESARAYDGKIYAVPTSAQTFALFVRKDWREKLGLEQPKTWDDVKALAEAFTKNDPDGNGAADTFGFTLPASTSRGYTSWFVSNYIWEAGGDFLVKQGDKFKPSLNTPEAAAGVTYIRDLVCAGVTQPGAINATTADAIPSFRSGQTGMFLSGPYHISLFDKEPGRDAFEVVPTPPGPKGAATLAEGTNAYVMRDSEEPEAVKSFIEYLISPEAQTIGMAVDGARIPVVRLPVNSQVNMADARKDDRWNTFATAFSDSGRYFPAIPNWTAVRQITSDSINKALSDCNSDIPATLAAADEAVAAELKKQDVLAE